MGARRNTSGKGAPAATRTALVLASYDSRDDKVVELFLEDEGRLPAIARNARKSTRRFGAHIQPLTLSEVVVRTRPDWDLARLDRAVTSHAFGVLKGDFLRMALASAMAEVVLMLLPAHDHDPDLYALTMRAWRHLDDPAAAATEELLLLFELRALQTAGFLPEIEALPGLDEASREVLSGWLAGRWSPLTPTAKRRVATVLEGMLGEQAGRGLRSREVLNEALALRD